MTSRFVTYTCPIHGFLLETVAGAVVKCGKCKGDTGIRADVPSEAPISPSKGRK